MRSRAVRLLCGVVAWIAIGGAALRRPFRKTSRRPARRWPRLRSPRARSYRRALRSPLRAASLCRRRPGRRVLDAEGRADGGRDRRVDRDAARTADQPGARSAIDEAVTHAGRVRRRSTHARAITCARVSCSWPATSSLPKAIRRPHQRRVRSRRLVSPNIRLSMPLKPVSADRKRSALAGAGVVTALVVMLLLLGGIGSMNERPPLSSSPLSGAEPSRLSTRQVAPVSPRRAAPCRQSSRRPLSCAPTSRACGTCTIFRQLLARAGDVMDAAGLVVWLGNAEGTRAAAGARPRVQRRHAGAPAECAARGQQRGGGRVSFRRCADRPSRAPAAPRAPSSRRSSALRAASARSRPRSAAAAKHPKACRPSPPSSRRSSREFSPSPAARPRGPARRRVLITAEPDCRPPRSLP